MRLDTLRDMRKKLAEPEGVPVYTILTEAQLAKMARSVPQTRTALGAVEGICAAKLECYGYALLALLLRFGCAPSTPLATCPPRHWKNALGWRFACSLL